MPVMDIILEGERAFEDWQERYIRHTKNTVRVTALSGGMESGKPSVAFGFELDDGSVVIAETSLALFLTAADAFKAKYGDPRT